MNQEKKDVLNRAVKKLGDMIDVVLIEHNLTEQRVYPEVAPSRGFSHGYKPDMFDGLEVKWETGGYDGGDWRGGKARRYSTNNPPLELSALMVVIDRLFPDVSFKDGCKLLKSVITDTEENREYYGNFQEFMRKRISTKDIYNWIISCNLEPADPSVSPMLYRI